MLSGGPIPGGPDHVRPDVDQEERLVPKDAYRQHSLGCVGKVFPAVTQDRNDSLCLVVAREDSSRLAKLAKSHGTRVKLSYAKVAEFQRRGLMAARMRRSARMR